MEKQWVSWDLKEEGCLISSKEQVIMAYQEALNWGLCCLGMWCCVIGWLEPDVLRQHGGLIFMGQNVHGETWRSLHGHFDPRRRDHHTVSERWALATIFQISTAPVQKLKAHTETHLLQQRESEKFLKKAVLWGIWGCTKQHQTCEDHGNQGSLHDKHCVVTGWLVDFSRGWRCYAEFTFWIQGQLIMNYRLDQVVRPEHVDVQSELGGLVPVPDSDQSVCC